MSWESRGRREGEAGCPGPSFTILGERRRFSKAPATLDSSNVRRGVRVRAKAKDGPGDAPEAAAQPPLDVRPERDAPRDQHFLDKAFADDLVELVLDLSPQRLQTRLRPAAELLGVALADDRRNPVFYQGPALANHGLDLGGVVGAGDDEDADVEEDGP